MRGLVLSALVLAVAESIKPTSLVLVDKQRGDRNVPVWLYYPDATQSTGKPLPLFVFAHCLMGANGWYDYLAQALVDAGYAFASIGTHQYVPAQSSWLATDQAFVLDELRRQSHEVPGSPLYGRLEGGKAAAGGHSLGGAATYFAADKNSKPLDGKYSADFATVVTMSACCGWDDFAGEPGICGSGHAYPPSLNVTRVPSLQLTGTKDCLCPPQDVAEPFFEKITSDCKYLVEFTGATHCHFDEIPSDRLGPIADKACMAIEDALCIIHPNKTKRISMQRQEQLTVEYVLAWLDWTLRDNISAFASFDARSRTDAADGSIVLKAGADGCPKPDDTLTRNWVV